ncbi:MAG: hypothetical protein ACR2MQ_05585 [Gemmatimonadaceae bacterium]
MSDFRARTNAEILDAAFEIYRRHFWVFFAVSVVATIPGGIARYLISRTSVLDPTHKPLLLALAWIVAGLIAPFAEAAFVTTTSNAYRGSVVDIADSIRSAFVRPWQLFAIVWARGIMLGLGMLLLIVPGLIVYKRYFAIVAAFTIEKLPARAAMTRSREISDDNGKRIFFLLGAVALFAIFAGAMLGGFLAAIAKGAIAAILYLVAVSLFTPFPAIVMTLLYYDIRIRREGYDIELLANALDGTIPVPPAQYAI